MIQTTIYKGPIYFKFKARKSKKSRQPDSESLNYVLEICAGLYGFTPYEIIRPDRSQKIKICRHTFCWVAKEYMRFETFKSIGIFLNNRDHSSVFNSCDFIDDCISTHKKHSSDDDIIKKLKLLLSLLDFNDDI